MHFFSPIVMMLLVSAPLRVIAQEEPTGPPRIPEHLILRLQEELAAAEDIESTTEKRRACKNTVRSAESLLEEYPDSPDRFRVLGTVFEVRKALFEMRPGDEAREAVLETARELLEAPDDDADIRLGADVLLQEIELDREESSPQDRAMAIAELADRYRGTAAEAESLMMASMIAFDMGHRALLDAFRESLSTRFGQDPDVSAFLRERFAVSHPVRFRGTFQRAGGTSIMFPTGQMYVLCFWSRDAPFLDDRIEEVRRLQARYPGQFKVFSFNLDERLDGGEGLLRRMKLDWTPMLLPGGEDNPTYLSVGGIQRFSALVVDPYGWASADAIGRPPTPLHKKYEAAVESPRHLALLRSLSIGDFLVMDAALPESTTLPQASLHSIQACFTLPPIRYRLTRDEEVKRYETAERLCGEVVAQHADAPDLWIVYNRRTIALLGLWRLSGDPSYLERAVASARATLALELPPGAATVPHFCLATDALRSGDALPAQVLAEFFDAAGGGRAHGGTAAAAALMLALDAHSGDEYVTYRDMLLGPYRDDPSTWQVASFLLDRSSSARLFEMALPDRGRSITAAQSGDRLFKATFTTQAGDTVVFPGETDGKVTAVVFMETPSDKTAETLQKEVLDGMVRMVSDRPLADMRIIAVCRGSDTNTVAATMTKDTWAFDAFCTSEGEWSQLCRQFGIVAADTRPNLFLVCPDGRLMLALSGVSPETGKAQSATRRMRDSVRTYDQKQAAQALLASDYRTYTARLLTSFPPDYRRRSKFEPTWRVPNAHRRKLVWAYMQMQEWQKALETANAAIHAHEQECRCCTIQLVPLFHRVTVLKELGREQDAAAALALAEAGRCPPGSTNEPRSMFPGAQMMRRQDLNERLTFVENYMRNDTGDRREDRVDLAGDLLMRATVLEALGKPADAARDRMRATALTWPYPPIVMDPHFEAEACAHRRKQARDHLVAQAWAEALACVNINIEGHESKPIRMGQCCSVCAMQIIPLRLRERMLRELGRENDRLAAMKMAEAALCPPGCKEEPHAAFPYRYFWDNSRTEARLDYVDAYLRHVGAGTENLRHRSAVAADLLIRAEALEHLGEAERAATDRRRAQALVWPLDARTASNDVALPARYVDIVDVYGENESGAREE